MSVFINPFTDFGFKRIFGQEDHKQILIGFLNALFKGELIVKDVTYRDKEQLGEYQQNRTVIYDIYCSLDDGSHVIVEMQNKREVNFDARALYYASRSIVSQGEKGDDWHYEYAPVIGVYFLNYPMDELGEAFRSDFEITKTKRITARTAFSTDDQRNKTKVKSSKVPFKGKLRLIFLQMPEFTKTETECTTDLDKWAFIMNHMENLTNIPWSAQNELYAELARVSNVAALSPRDRAIYDENLKQYRDNIALYEAAIEEGIKEGKELGIKEGKELGIKEGKELGIKEGKEQGVKEERAKVAKSMLMSGSSIQFVMQCTGLSEQECETLK